MTGGEFVGAVAMWLTLIAGGTLIYLLISFGGIDFSWRPLLGFELVWIPLTMRWSYLLTIYKEESK